ncbi:MAG: hypothetical protein G01um10142_103 [Parcubacteria group bacterium Gr01-1014_2]|nr:MAG: hypothetical protein G01um10142_103 [Parcubacteria group bacterium Gr01-1014_2]
MKRFVFSLFAAVVLLFPSFVLAQEANSSDKVVDTKFMLVVSSLVASMVFDVETSFAGIKKHPEINTREGNPVMKLFVNAGRPATYALLSGAEAGLVSISYWMKKSKKPAIRKIWWAVPVVGTTSHAIGGGVNLRFVFR